MANIWDIYCHDVQLRCSMTYWDRIGLAIPYESNGLPYDTPLIVKYHV